MIMLSRKCDRLFLKIQERFLAFYRIQLSRITSDSVVSSKVHGIIENDQKVSARLAKGDSASQDVKRLDAAAVLMQTSSEMAEDVAVAPNQHQHPHADSVESEAQIGLLADESPEKEEQKASPDGPSEPRTAGSGAGAALRSQVLSMHAASQLGILAHSDFICAWQVCTHMRFHE